MGRRRPLRVHPPVVPDLGRHAGRRATPSEVTAEQGLKEGAPGCSRLWRPSLTDRHVASSRSITAPDPIPPLSPNYGTAATPGNDIDDGAERPRGPIRELALLRRLDDRRHRRRRTRQALGIGVPRGYQMGARRRSPAPAGVVERPCEPDGAFPTDPLGEAA